MNVDERKAGIWILVGLAIAMAAAAALVGGCGSVSSASDVEAGQKGGAGGEAGGHGGAQLGGDGGGQGGGGGVQTSTGGGGGAGVGGGAGGGASVDAGPADAGCEAGAGTSCVDGQACMLSQGDAWIKCAACPGGGAHASCGGTRYCCVTAPPSPTGLPWCAAAVGCALN